MKENIEIHTAAGTTELVIREGEAFPAREKNPLKIKGSLDAPLRFIKNRIGLLPQFESNILVNIEKGTVSLMIGEKSELHDLIEGELTPTENITQFGINNGKYISPADLSNFLRARKHLFESQAQYTEIFTALRNFKAKVNQEIAAIKDDSGNYEQKKQQIVDHNVPRSFKVNIPLFKGMPKVTFEVEILVNKDLDVTMYSTELIQITDELREKYLNEQVAEIEKIAPDIVILYQ